MGGYRGGGPIMDKGKGVERLQGEMEKDLYSGCGAMMRGKGRS